MSHPLVIMWFRHDLRLNDNPALYRAIDLAGEHGNVLPIFIHDTSAPDLAKLGEASQW